MHTLRPDTSMPIQAAEATAPRRGTGVMFLAVFATLWLLLGCKSLSGTHFALLTVIGAMGAGLLLKGLSLSRAESESRAKRPGQEHRAKLFRAVNIVQWSAILAWIAALNILGAVQWITPGIMLIVGVHFLPLAKLFDNKAHYLTGCALTAVAMIYPFVMAQGPLSPWGPIAAGLILWLSAGYMLWSVPRARFV